MLRIAGVVLPEKRIVIALTAIKGIGQPLAARMLAELQIGQDKRPDALTEEEQARLRARVEQETIEGELTRKVSLDIKRPQDIGTWRGYRHRRKPPVRGQTSRLNVRTKRGQKRSVLAGRVTLTQA